MTAGVGAAYKEVKTPDNSVSQGLQFWGQLAATKNENDILHKEREDKETEDIAKEYGNVDDIAASVTGFQSFDQIADNASTEVKNKYVQTYRDFMDARKSNNPVKQEEARMKLVRYKDSFKKIKELSDILAVKYKDYQKLAAENKISGVDKNNWEAQMQSIVQDKNFKVDVGDNGEISLVGIQKLDGGGSYDLEDVDVSTGKRKPFVIKMPDIVNGSWRPYARQEFGETAGKILKGLGSYEELKQKGLYTVKSQLWNPQVEEGAKQQIQLLIGSDEFVADFLNQQDSTSTQKKDFTPEQRISVADSLLKMVKAGYKQKYEVEFNKDLASHQVAVKNSNEAARHNRQEEAIGKQNAGTAAYVARTGRINAETTRTKVNHDITKGDEKEKDLADVKISKPYAEKGKDGRTRSFSTFTLSDKNSGNVTPIVVGIGSDGKPLNTLAVDIDTKTGDMRYTDASGDVQEVKSNTPLYNTIYNQIIGRDQVTADGTTSAAPVAPSNSDPLGLGL